MRKPPLRFLLAAALAALLCAPAARAQTAAPPAAPPAALAVLHTAADAQSDHLALSVFFTLRDRNGEPVLRRDVQLDQMGAIQLTGAASAPVPATIKEPSTPIRIALVIDASGSMAGRMKDVKEAAKKAVELAPPQAEIAVFTFSDLFEQQTDFLNRGQQLQTIQDAISVFKTRAVNEGDTCLYDAASQAIDKLFAGSVQDDVTRRALILFTDGIEQENGGATCKTMFSKDQIVTKAQQTKGATLPIYAIGLCASEDCKNVRRDEMQDLSKRTSATSAFGALTEMGAKFAYIMEALNSQWVALADVYPPKGASAFSITAKMNNGGPLSGSGSFESPNEYAGKPKFTLTPKYVAEKDSFAVTLNVVNPAATSKVALEIWDGETNGTIVKALETITNPGENQSFDLSTKDLQPNQPYWFHIKAWDRNGNPIKNEKNDDILATHGFKYTPELGYTIEDVKPDWSSKTVAIQLKVHGQGNNTLVFKGKIADKATGEVVADIAQTPLKDQMLTVPLPAKWQAGDERMYAVTLNLDDNGRELTQVFERAISPPPTPGFFARVGAALASPLALAMIAAVLVAVLGGLIYLKRKPKTEMILSPFNSPTMIVEADQARARGAGAPTVAAQASKRVRIKVLRTVDRTQLFEATLPLPCVLGRKGADFAIEGDDGISRRHAQVTLQGGELFITDLKSTNGTFITNQPVQAGAITPLPGRAEVRLGPHTSLLCELV